jgi:hypothetical protein
MRLTTQTRGGLRGPLPAMDTGKLTVTVGGLGVVVRPIHRHLLVSHLSVDQRPSLHLRARPFVLPDLDEAASEE